MDATPPPLVEAHGEVRLPRAALIVERALVGLLGVLMLFIVGLNVANVAGRYIFSMPVPAADEIMTFAMVWGVFLGAAVVTLRGTHLTMDLVAGLLPRRARRVAEAAGAIALVTILGFIALQSLEYLDVIGTIGLTSMAAGLPMAWVHAAIPVGFGLMALAALLRLFGRRA
ncbi:TRAP transporter small permease [Roseomonas sp. KE2513]|uniref:TRAP transporter small permease n=1 Tax=Roseomonas sp. KE2513 TaxID=2479202 RepID=UPI0018DF017C|nr:TRAP transporter small permease [Roseomonas sp. KE2513]MBI0533967.1 TRAP transporter small permease [Roseomonas sp. KE2513]